jgi:hypothetical protein
MGNDASSLPAGVPPPRAATQDELTAWQVALAEARGCARWPEVLAAVRAGHGFEAERLLRKRLEGELADDERRRILDLLRVRRIFVERAAKPPGLGRLNGVGTGMYGGADFDASDGTYLKTRYVSFLWVPIVPIDQWLVRDAENGGWYFLARAPLTREARRLSVAMIAVITAAVLTVVGLVLARGLRPEVHLLNGLPADAELTIDDGDPVTVAAGAHTSLRVGSGNRTFRCRIGGRVIDERRVSVPAWSDFIAYSVAGAEALVEESIPYSADAHRPGQEPTGRTTVLVGQVWVVRSSMDYVFKDPPASVSIPSSEKGTVWKHRITLQGRGWRDALVLLEEDKGPAAAAEAAETMALAVPAATEVVDEATSRGITHREAARFQAFLGRLAAAKAEAGAAPGAPPAGRIPPK